MMVCFQFFPLFFYSTFSLCDLIFFFWRKEGFLFLICCGTPSIKASVIIYSAFPAVVQVRMYFRKQLVTYVSCEFTLKKPQTCKVSFYLVQQFYSISFFYSLHASWWGPPIYFLIESFPCINMQLMFDCFVLLLTPFSATHALSTEKHCRGVPYKVFAWKKMEILWGAERTHEVLQIQLGLGILSRAGSKWYIPAKIQGLPARTGELWNNTLTMMLCPAKAHGLLSWSSTTGHTPWLLISTAAESTERPLSLQRVMHCRSAGLSWAFTQLKFKCLHLCVKGTKASSEEKLLFLQKKLSRRPQKKKADQPKHQVLVFSPKISDPRFLPQWMLFTQSFFIYIKHCWAHFFAIKF